MRNRSNSSGTGSTGIGILTVLLIVFIVLKLTGNVSWPWAIVLIPLWIQLFILVIFFIAYAIVWLSRRM